MARRIPNYVDTNPAPELLRILDEFTTPTRDYEDALRDLREAVLAGTPSESAGTSVNAYGAVGTANPADATQNTQALRDAIEAARASNRKVVVLPGWYYINDTVELTEYMPGIEGLGGAASVRFLWAGAKDGRPMFRFKAKGQFLRNMTIQGDGTASSYADATVVGLLMYPGLEGNFVQNSLSDVRFLSCAKAIRCARPNPLAGGQNEGMLIERCRFDGCRVGVSIEHKNVDYWMYLSTYWAGCDVGVNCDYSVSAAPEDQLGGASGHTFIGCVATGNWGSPFGTWLQLANQGGWGAWRFVNCQTEAMPYAAVLRGLGHVVIDGAFLGKIKVDNFAGYVSVRNSSIAFSTGVATLESAFEIASGYLQLHLDQVRFSAQDGEEQTYFDGGIDEFIAAGGIVMTGNANPYGYTVRDFIMVTDDATYRWRSYKPVTIRQQATYGWAAQPSLEVEGGNSAAPIAKFKSFALSGTPADRFQIGRYGEPEVLTAGQGLVVRSPNGTKYRIAVSDAGVLTATVVT